MIATLALIVSVIGAIINWWVFFLMWGDKR